MLLSSNRLLIQINPTLSSFSVNTNSHHGQQSRLKVHERGQCHKVHCSISRHLQSAEPATFYNRVRDLQCNIRGQGNRSTASAKAAWSSPSGQFLVGASRRRAAPRSQSYGAAHVAFCHIIGYRGPLNLHRLSELRRPNAAAAQMQNFHLLPNLATKPRAAA